MTSAEEVAEVEHNEEVVSFCNGAAGKVCNLTPSGIRCSSNAMSSVVAILLMAKTEKTDNPTGVRPPDGCDINDVDESLAAGQKCYREAMATLSPFSCTCPVRQLPQCERALIRKITKGFFRAVHSSAAYNPGSAPDDCSTDCFVQRVKCAILGLLDFANCLADFSRLPPYVQVVLLQAATPNYLMLQSVLAFDVTAGMWNVNAASPFGLAELGRAFPAVDASVWNGFAELALSFKPIFSSGSSSRAAGHGFIDAASYALLHAVSIMSPEYIASCADGKYSSACATVSDTQLRYTLLLRHHLESQSLLSAAEQLAALLERLSAVKRQSALLSRALLSSEEVQRDRLLADALSAMHNGGYDCHYV